MKERNITFFSWPNDGSPYTRDIHMCAPPWAQYYFWMCMLMVQMTHSLCTTLSLPPSLSCLLLPLIISLSSRCRWCMLLQSQCLFSPAVWKGWLFSCPCSGCCWLPPCTPGDQPFCLLLTRTCPGQSLSVLEDNLWFKLLTFNFWF